MQFFIYFRIIATILSAVESGRDNPKQLSPYKTKICAQRQFSLGLMDR